MKIKLTSKREVFSFCEPYIIAEIGSNHNGDMELAKRLTVAAKEAGADCVKFQSWSKETIFSRKVYEENYFLRGDYRSRSDYTLEEIVDEFAISEQELLEMKKFTDEVGIDCTSTPFSKKEVDFIVDVVQDFKNILLSTNQDEIKGVIALGGSISKHHAIFSCLLNGGLDYAIYMTTARESSGSMSGATTNEAKSWGKIKDDSDAVTVIGDVTINFPIAMISALEKLSREGLIKDE